GAVDHVGRQAGGGKVLGGERGDRERDGVVAGRAAVAGLEGVDRDAGREGDGAGGRAGGIEEVAGGAGGVVGGIDRGDELLGEQIEIVAQRLHGAVAGGERALDRTGAERERRGGRAAGDLR